MKRNITTAILFFMVGAAVVGLLLFPKEVSLAVREGLGLCADTLFPTLFPFLVLSGFLVRSGLAQRIVRPLENLAGFLFCLPGVCSSALILGLIGGYPTGAKTVVELYQNGQCSRQEAERMLSFCNNCGPGFLVSSIGYGLFGNIHCGLLLYATHLSAAVLTGIILAPSGKRRFFSSSKAPDRPGDTFPSAFVTSVTDAMYGFINLAAFVLCFSAITCLIQISGIPHKFSTLLPFSQENAPYLLLGLLEMTSGTLHLSGGALSEQMILAAALVGWGGLSVHCQVLSLLQNTDLSPALYFKGKALHALVCALLTAVILGVIPAGCFAGVLCLYRAAAYFRKKAVEKKRKVYYNAS